MTEDTDLTIKLKDGRSVDITRGENKEVRISDGEAEVTLPHASGQVTLDMLTLLDGVIEEDSNGAP